MMVRFQELSCLAKYAHFSLRETALWSSYLICEIGENGLGKVCVSATCVRVYLCMYVCVNACMCMYIHICIYSILTVCLQREVGL